MGKMSSDSQIISTGGHRYVLPETYTLSSVFTCSNGKRIGENVRRIVKEWLEAIERTRKSQEQEAKAKRISESKCDAVEELKDIVVGAAENVEADMDLFDLKKHNEPVYLKHASNEVLLPEGSSKNSKITGGFLSLADLASEHSSKQEASRGIPSFSIPTFNQSDSFVSSSLESLPSFSSLAYLHPDSVQNKFQEPTTVSRESNKVLASDGGSSRVKPSEEFPSFKMPSFLPQSSELARGSSNPLRSQEFDIPSLSSFGESSRYNAFGSNTDNHEPFDIPSLHSKDHSKSAQLKMPPPTKPFHIPSLGSDAGNFGSPNIGWLMPSYMANKGNNSCASSLDVSSVGSDYIERFLGARNSPNDGSLKMDSQLSLGRFAAVPDSIDLSIALSSSVNVEVETPPLDPKSDADGSEDKLIVKYMHIENTLHLEEEYDGTTLSHVPMSSFGKHLMKSVRAKVNLPEYVEAVTIESQMVPFDFSVPPNYLGRKNISDFP